MNLRVERKCGQLLQEMAERGERAAKGRPDKSGTLPDLKTLGLDEDESRRFQQVAAVPQKRFAAALAEKFERAKKKA